jgi:hypothetical protein
MDAQELLAAIFIAGMFSGVFVIFLAMRQRAEVLQMQHRERMAMIERGQVPLADGVSRGSSNAASSRSMSLGIIVIGLGMALMTIVSIAGGSPEAGVGVGGAIVILGAAFIVRSLVVKTAPPSTTLPPVVNLPPGE